VGPWSHRYPHFGQAGNGIEFLQECLRWWGHWLRGQDTGVMEGPMVRLFVQEHSPPSTTYAPKPGRWVAEDAWPSEHIGSRELVLGSDTLLDREAAHDLEPEPRQVRSPLTVGQLAGKWLAYSATPDMPGDQRPEDGGSLVFETALLEEPLDVVGAPAAVLDLSVDRPVAQVAARLCDVPPAGPVTRVTYGLLNLTHRDSHEYPQALEPGARYRVRVPLAHCAQRFEAGHRIRLSLSTSYWPLAWPPPEPVTLTVHTGTSTLELPVRPPRDEDADLPAFEEPEAAPPFAVVELEPGEYRCVLERDLATDETIYHRIKDGGLEHIRDLDLRTKGRAVEKYVHTGEDFESVRGEVEWLRELERGDWRIRTVCRTVQTCTKDTFRVVATMHAYEGDREVYSRSWDREIRRDLV
ncbi:MAG: CocE/NonD family hydrolase, partial [Polyangiales bacterium]